MIFILLFVEVSLALNLDDYFIYVEVDRLVLVDFTCEVIALNIILMFMVVGWSYDIKSVNLSNKFRDLH